MSSRKNSSNAVKLAYNIYDKNVDPDKSNLIVLHGKNFYLIINFLFVNKNFIFQDYLVQKTIGTVFVKPSMRKQKEK